jgi:hypothetical protein
VREGVIRTGHPKSLTKLLKGQSNGKIGDNFCLLSTIFSLKIINAEKSFACPMV